MHAFVKESFSGYSSEHVFWLLGPQEGKISPLSVVRLETELWPMEPRNATFRPQNPPCFILHVICAHLVVTLEAMR